MGQLWMEITVKSGADFDEIQHPRETDEPALVVLCGRSEESASDVA